MRMQRVLKVLAGVLLMAVLHHHHAIGQPNPLAQLHFDENGLIVHAGTGCTFDERTGEVIKSPGCKLDGGDTAQREGWYWLGIILREKNGMPPFPLRRRLSFEQVLQRLEPHHDGVFYRHPTLPSWSNPYDKDSGTSRDQLIPLIAAMGLDGHQSARLLRLWNALPQDAGSKAAFNGNWRNGLGQPGWDCTGERNRSCGPTMSCDVPVVSRDCTARRDTRDCGAGEDRRDCSVHLDTDDCAIRGPFGVKVPNGNVGCALNRDRHNAQELANKARCETEKANANKLWEPKRAACIAEQTTANAAYTAMAAQCDLTNTSIANAAAHVRLLCEGARLGNGCEAMKLARTELCRATNVFSGDVLGPDVVNLFLRALSRNVLMPNLDLLIPPSVIRGGIDGDKELVTNVDLRIAAGWKDMDDVGPDLNVIVALIMAELRSPTPDGEVAVTRYRRDRVNSYGSYLDQYYRTYGAEAPDMEAKIKAGIAQGWKPEGSAIYGVIRWYHRDITGANPALASLYEPIIRKFLK